MFSFDTGKSVVCKYARFYTKAVENYQNLAFRYIIFVNKAPMHTCSFLIFYNDTEASMLAVNVFAKSSFNHIDGITIRFRGWMIGIY